MARSCKAFLALIFAAIAGTSAAAYPERPITMIIAYPPGGGTDVVARAIAPFLEKYLGGGAKLLVVNRSGAGGEVGMAALANAPADGYTIGFINTPPLMTIPIERQAIFGSPQRFELRGNIIDDPCNFAVHTDTPVKNLQELAAWARANPGRLTVGTTGVGSDDHLLMLMFERAAGVKLTHVPFKGSSEMRAAIMGKQVDVVAMNVGESLQSIRGGAPMRNLGQFGPARSNLAPDLPTGRALGAAAWWWWQKNAASFKEASQAFMLDGQKAGAALGESGCVAKAVARHGESENRTFIQSINTALFLRGCLDESKAEAKFCEGVPSKEEILSYALWAAQSCANLGFTD